jgi:ribose-phosphate pyrophosphokinase
VVVVELAQPAAPEGALIVVAAPGYEGPAAALAERLGAAVAPSVVHRFPDGECLVRIDGELAGRDVVVVSGLERPAERLLPIVFLAGTARDLGARRVGLVAPYLAFMRQDSRFHPGEGLTSTYFARLLGGAIDWLCTVDPHLHRWSSLDLVYPIPTQVVHAAPAIAAWLTANVEAPLLIGPDAESAQWVDAVAALAGCPRVVLTKTRRGDRDVTVSPPDLTDHGQRQPVILDDIISTGRTMIETIRHLRGDGVRPPVCVGVHGVFADRAHDELLAAGAARVVTCDTIAHPSNQIAIGALLADGVRAIVAR